MPEIVNTAPLTLPIVSAVDPELWSALLDLAQADLPEWTLAGGQMVLLHGLERGRDTPRPSTDIDAIVNARLLGATADFAQHVQRLGFEAERNSPDGVVHRFLKGRAIIDVLAPEGLGSQEPLMTVPAGRTIEVPGGTQALHRTELVRVAVGERIGLVPRPNLLGAIVLKACAIGVDDAPQDQRRDLAFLLSLVSAPYEMAAEMKNKDRARLRRFAGGLTDPSHPAWSGVDDGADAIAALHTLLG